MWETSRNKLKKHSVTKNCSDLSLFKWIVLVISKFLQILIFQPWISIFFSVTKTVFSRSRSEQFRTQNTTFNSNTYIFRNWFWFISWTFINIFWRFHHFLFVSFIYALMFCRRFYHISPFICKKWSEWPLILYSIP